MIRTRSVMLDAGDLQIPAEVDLPEEDAGAPRFLIAHGAGGNRHTPGLKVLAQGLTARGYVVVRPDLPYRAAGRSAPPKAERSVDGFRRLFDSAVREVGEARPWIVGGRSYGARVASMAVAEGLEAAGLMLYSYPLHRPGNPAEPRVQHWPQIGVPTLFLEGTHDPFCDLELFRRHLPDLGVEPTVHVVEGADHSLKVAGKRAPDGRPRAEAAVVADLVTVIDDWVRAALAG